MSSSYVRSFNRYEYKYVLDLDAARDLRKDLEPYTVADQHSDGEQGYPVYSVYWDNDGLTFFWEKLDGFKFRRKLRFRRYEGTEDAFIEIKQRIDRTVQKRRVRYPIREIQRGFGWNAPKDGPEADDALDESDPVTLEARFLRHHYGLEPKMAVRYRRLALFAVREPDLRITFDTRLQYHACDLDLDRPFETGKYLLDPNLTVLEIKFNNRIPLWLCRMAEKHELKLVRISKYCTAVDLEYFGGRYS